MARKWIQSANVEIDADTGALRVAAKGNGFVARDASVAPNASPIAISTDPISLTWPANAISMIVRPIDADVSLLDATGASITIPANIYFEVAGKPGDTTVINRSIATALEFAFEVQN